MLACYTLRMLGLSLRHRPTPIGCQMKINKFIFAFHPRLACWHLQGPNMPVGSKCYILGFGHAGEQAPRRDSHPANVSRETQQGEARQQRILHSPKIEADVVVFGQCKRNGFAFPLDSCGYFPIYDIAFFRKKIGT